MSFGTEDIQQNCICACEFGRVGIRNTNWYFQDPKIFLSFKIELWLHGFHTLLLVAGGVTVLLFPWKLFEMFVLLSAGLLQWLILQFVLWLVCMVATCFWTWDQRLFLGFGFPSFSSFLGVGCIFLNWTVLISCFLIPCLPYKLYYRKLNVTACHMFLRLYLTFTYPHHSHNMQIYWITDIFVHRCWEKWSNHI